MIIFREPYDVFYPLDGPQGANTVLFGIGAAITGESLCRVWSQRMFPTMLRTAARGIAFAFVGLHWYRRPRCGVFRSLS